MAASCANEVEAAVFGLAQISAKMLPAATARANGPCFWIPEKSWLPATASRRFAGRFHLARSQCPMSAWSAPNSAHSAFASCW